MSVRMRDLMRATGIVMGLFVISRVTGLARDIVISQQFGTSAQYDAYVAAFRIPDLLFNVIAGGALSSAFIPTFAGLLAHEQRDEAWRLASGIINLVLLVVAAAALITFVFAEPLVDAILAPGFAPEQKALTVNLVRLMLFTPIVFSVSGTSMGILNSFHQFTLPAVAPILYNLAIIGGALVLAPVWGAFGLAFGVVLGSLLHLAIQLPTLLRHGFKYAPVLGLRDPHVREVGRLMLPRTIGLATVQINFIVNTILASNLPAGRLSALDYAFRLMLLPEAIVAQAIATTVFPTFSRLAAQNDLAALRDVFSHALRATLFLAVPASMGLVLLRVPLTRLLFERGAFTSESTAEVAVAVQYYALALVAHSSLEIIARAFYALHDTATPVKIGFAAMALNVLLSVALIGPLAQGGLALANSIATVLETLVLLWLLRERLGGLDGAQLVASACRMAGAAVAMGGAITFFLLLLNPVWWIAALGGMAVGGSVYLVSAWLLHSDEIAIAWNLLRGHRGVVL